MHRMGIATTNSRLKVAKLQYEAVYRDKPWTEKTDPTTHAHIQMKIERPLIFRQEFRQFRQLHTLCEQVLIQSISFYLYFSIPKYFIVL